MIPEGLLAQHITNVHLTKAGGVIDVGYQPQTMERAAAYPQTTVFGESQLQFSVPKNVEIDTIIINQTYASFDSMPFNFGQMVGRTPSLSSNPYCAGGNS